MNQQRPRGVRPVLLLVVYGVFLVVVGVTATLQTGCSPCTSLGPPR